MTVHLVTFSDHQMNRARQLCIESALKHGVDSIAGPHYFDPAIEYRDGFTLEWLKSQPIYEQMGEAWWTQRGVGFWLWKSYLIELIMSKLPDGDYLVYADAGVEFIDNIRYVIDRMDQDVWLFGNNWEHAHWCKRDVVDEVWELLAYDDVYLDYSPLRKGALVRDDDGGLSWSNFGKQCQASVIFFRVSDYSRQLIKEWLDWCLFEGGRLIDDSPSRAPNHPEFREHRHDQAILTTLAYREGIRLHYWPAMYNDGAFTYEKLPEYAGDDYPALFHHHRKRNHEWK